MATLPAPLRRPVLAARARVRRLVLPALRGVLVRHARGGPPAERPRVIILLVSAWGMGGTIRAALNMAGHLAATHDVEIVSAYRRREESFFGAFPPGVRVHALDDQRRGHAPAGLAGWVRRQLRKRSSVLMSPHDGTSHEFTLWSDVRLVRRLRGARGHLIGTRPGLNLMAALLSPPGCATIGLEQMHLDHHRRALRRAMRRAYPRLDRIVVLTERDERNYTALLEGRGRLARIPNTVREMEGAPADLAAPVVLTAGRLRLQKGFDLLIGAYAQVAGEFPDWRLRICGSGKERRELLDLIEAHDVGDVIALEGPSERLGEDMAAASIFALSSRYEGFPLILLEAMSKGMGVVAFDCPTGPADMVDDHRNGLLIPPEDVDAFAAGLREMMGDEELRRRCGAAAVGTAAQYTMAAIGPRWEALLAELDAERAAR